MIYPDTSISPLYPGYVPSTLQKDTVQCTIVETYREYPNYITRYFMKRLYRSYTEDTFL